MLLDIFELTSGRYLYVEEMGKNFIFTQFSQCDKFVFCDINDMDLAKLLLMMGNNGLILDKFANGSYLSIVGSKDFLRLKLFGEVSYVDKSYPKILFDRASEVRITQKTAFLLAGNTVFKGMLYNYIPLIMADGGFCGN